MCEAPAFSQGSHRQVLQSGVAEDEPGSCPSVTDGEQFLMPYGAWARAAPCSGLRVAAGNPGDIYALSSRNPSGGSQGAQTPHDRYVISDSIMVLLPSRLTGPALASSGRSTSCMVESVFSTTSLFKERAYWFTFGIPKATVAGDQGWCSIQVLECG
ncbi:Oxysterol-Binding Protein-Related Protein 10 [Manis pentadactyla]|nr:Oxysterol-Binding Protein-Related Protein 10 [Manis pentadactyla]